MKKGIIFIPDNVKIDNDDFETHILGFLQDKPDQPFTVKELFDIFANPMKIKIGHDPDQFLEGTFRNITMSDIVDGLYHLVEEWEWKFKWDGKKDEIVFFLKPS